MERIIKYHIVIRAEGDKNIIASLRSNDDGLPITEPLPTILRICAERKLNVDNYMEMVLKLLDYYNLH